MSSDELGTLRSSGLVASVPVIRGTKVPLATLAEYLQSSKGAEQFLRHFPAVSEAQLQATLASAVGALIELRIRVPGLRSTDITDSTDAS
ncbi:MAG: DUF433 domain-containing protein [Gemmatimonadota bacterium]